MGLTGAAVGFNNALQQILADRYAQQAAERQYKDRQRQQQFDNDMKVQQFQSNEELKHAQLDATSEARHQAAIGQQVGQANALGDQLPEGTFLPEGDQGVSIMQTGGRGSMLTPQDERPAVETGPLLPGDTGAAKAKGYIKTASAKQINERTDNERQAKSEADRVAREMATTTETNRHNRAMENKPQAEAGWTIQQGMVDGKPGWVRINSHTGQIAPVSAGELTPKPSAQEAQETRTKTDTLDTLAQLDRAIDDAKDLLGPGAGRFSNFEQMAGSADPRIQALGVKMKAAKMRVDHAMTGSVRAGASPMMMQQWDNILANKVTPEGLKAGVQAMREILGGGQSAHSSAPSGGKPTAEDLIRKYGGGR